MQTQITNPFHRLNHPFISKDISWSESNSQTSSLSLRSSNSFTAEPKLKVSPFREFNHHNPDKIRNAIKESSSSPPCITTSLNSATFDNNDIERRSSAATTVPQYSTPEIGSGHSVLPLSFANISEYNSSDDAASFGLNSSDNNSNNNSLADLNAGSGRQEQRQEQRQVTQAIQGQEREEHGWKQDQEQQKQGQRQPRAQVATHKTATSSPTTNKAQKMYHPFQDFARKKHKSSGYHQKKKPSKSTEMMSKLGLSSANTAPASAGTAAAAQAAATTTSPLCYNPMIAAAAQFHGSPGVQLPPAQLGYSASQRSLIQPQHQPQPMVAPTIFMQPANASRKQMHKGGSRSHRKKLKGSESPYSDSQRKRKARRLSMRGVVPGGPWDTYGGMVCVPMMSPFGNAYAYSQHVAPGMITVRHNLSNGRTHQNRGGMSFGHLSQLQQRAQTSSFSPAAADLLRSYGTPAHSQYGQSIMPNLWALALASRAANTNINLAGGGANRMHMQNMRNHVNNSGISSDGSSRTASSESWGSSENEHERIKLKPIKRFQCTYCEKSYCTRKSLNRHKKLHTGQNLQYCKFCNKKFSSKDTLRDHERTHTGEKPLKCNVCGKRFIQKGNFNRHLKTHLKRKTRLG